MEDAVIRELDLRDAQTAEDIWYLQHAAYREEALRLGLKHIPPLTDTIASLRSGRERYFGCELNGEWVGAVAYTVAGGMLTIRRLMVHPDHFRKGIATALLRRLLAEVPHERAEVYAGERNEPAVNLYRKFGFRPVERVEAEHGVQLMRMVRDATAAC
jgi:GNAT superfamily N-acetyltransferase